MLLTYNQCLKKYKSDYQIKKKLESGDLFKIEKGIYSDEPYTAELSVIMEKYPNAVLTLNSAFYYHALTDVIPDCYYLSTDRDASKIHDNRVKQIFEHSDHMLIGATTMEYQRTFVRIYNRERMLVELIRNKSKLPYDYYKEIIGHFREICNELDIEKLQDYALRLPKSKMVMEILQAEVF